VTGDERASELLSGAVEAQFVEPLARFAALVLEANERFNLTGAKTADEFVPHILDSVTVVPYIREPYVDVGSGAGLPGIPAALVTGARTTLIEATAKKAAFLRDAIEALGLSAKVDVRAARAEDAGRDPNLREHFQSATIRAVASGPAALELTAPFLSVGGVAILQRGPAGRTEPLAAAAEQLGCRIEAERFVGEGNRRLVLIEKLVHTDARFPRRVGLAQKHPLS
jgi:16S rRNA (guanine527-N7)-methyltransferase